MPSAETESAVALEIRIDASPETVFDFFTDPDKTIQWMGRSASSHGSKVAHTARSFCRRLVEQIGFLLIHRKANS